MPFLTNLLSLPKGMCCAFGKVQLPLPQENLAHKLTCPGDTTLLGFFSLCVRDPFARTLLYCEVPSYYVWRNNAFHRRKQGTPVPTHPVIKKDDAIGRVYTIHPNTGECYYLRLLLHEVRGPTSFNALKTVERFVRPTYQAACKALGLLEDDNHWVSTLQEAARCQSPSQLRDLFVTMLAFCSLADPLALWEAHQASLSEDLSHRLTASMDDLPPAQIHSLALNHCLHLLQVKSLFPPLTPYHTTPCQHC